MAVLLKILLSFVALFRRPPALPAADTPTAGPESDEHPLVPIGEVVKANWGEAGAQQPVPPAPWVSGWYLHAKQTPAHAKRVGPVISPKVVVVHTTDMHPSSHDALVRAWTTKPGAGNGAHFLIGRTAAQGIRQFCQITRNANHAGGKTGHGWYRLPTGHLLHPNTVAVGIELDNAGALKMLEGRWVHPDSGREIPTEDVHVDDRGRGWHRWTDYQCNALRELLRDLDGCLLSLPEGTRLVSRGTYKDNGVLWAWLPSTRVVGHVTLDPTNKTDPGPLVMQWLRSNT